MNRPNSIGMWVRRTTILVAAAGCCLLDAAAMAGDGALAFHRERNRLSADIAGWPLMKLLQEMADLTDWEVYYEPRSDAVVSTRFEALPPGAALNRMLGDLDFALLPGEPGVTRLFVYRTSLNGATERVLARESDGEEGSEDGADPFSNELIVSLKDGAETDIDSLAKGLGAKVTGRLDEYGAYRLEFEDEDAASAARQELENRDDVDSVNANDAISRPGSPGALSDQGAIPPRIQAKTPAPGEGVIVGLIDTSTAGASPQVQDFLLPQQSVAGEAPPLAEGQIGHGSAMAETILRGLEFVEDGDSSLRILPVDVYGPSSNTSSFAVVQGIAEAVEGGATIINMSLGGVEPNAFVGDVISDLHDQGVLFVGAAGNEPVTTPTYPAAFEEVIAVTAGDARGNVAPYANRGDFVDVVAPGGSIVHDANNRAYYGTGTSYSSAYVTGVLGGVASAGGGTPADYEAQVRSALTPPAP